MSATISDQLPEWKQRLLQKKRTVTIGNVNVELRKVSSPSTEEPCGDVKDEDLRYGPGIVDRLKAKFLNIGVTQQKKTVVRRYCSLENLPGSNQPYRVNTRVKSGLNSVKKAQSMETLPSLIPEQTRRRRPPDMPSSCRPSAPKINEHELPKPDTVKHVKKLFESTGDSEKSRPIRQMPTTSWNGDVRPPVKKILEEDDAKAPSAKKSDVEIISSPDIVGSDTTPESCEIQMDRSQPSLHSPAGGKAWTPSNSTSVVFDFRGRPDVEPHIALNPTPFGCKPVPQRPGSPPLLNEKEEEWDELDIGADLPAISGIIFTGENVKIGKGALLETRNKKLNIQFDDKAISTYEYPSESTSPSPKEEKNLWGNSFEPSTAMSSAANSRLGLSNYMPQTLSFNDEFELGVSKSNLRPIKSSDESQSPSDGDVPFIDAIIPAGPDDTIEWSANETLDILF